MPDKPTTRTSTRRVRTPLGEEIYVPPDPLEHCAHLHGKCGEWIYRHYPGQGTQRVAAYEPTNPQTPTQMNWRFIFADAIAAWKALSPAEQATWNAKAIKQGTRGTYLFRSWYLKQHPNVGSTVKIGTTRIGGLDTIG